MDSDPIDNIVDLLINDREKIIDIFNDNCSFDEIRRICNRMETIHNENIDDKFVYRILMGDYSGSKYRYSVLHWLPSRELVKALIDLAVLFDITHIEEMDAGIGILSALMKCNTKIKISTSDPFTDKRVCGQLGYVPIARRSVRDFAYYEQLNIAVPQMIITSFYQSEINIEAKMDYVKNISKLLRSKKHKIIVIIVPDTFNEISDIFRYYVMHKMYRLFPYPINVVDKYYISSVKNSVCWDRDVYAYVLIDPEYDPKKMSLVDGIFHDCIKNNVYPLGKNTHMKWIDTFYERSSLKLTQSIFAIIDMAIPLKYDILVNRMCKNLVNLDTHKIHRVPDYIHKVDEFIFFSLCVIMYSMYLHFDSRDKYMEYYNECKSLELGTSNIVFPEWISTKSDKCKYIYLNKLDIPPNWNTGIITFTECWQRINEENKKKYMCGGH